VGFVVDKVHWDRFFSPSSFSFFAGQFLLFPRAVSPFSPGSFSFFPGQFLLFPRAVSPLLA